MDELSKYDVEDKSKGLRGHPWSATGLFLAGAILSIGLFSFGMSRDRGSPYIVMVNQVSAESLKEKDKTTVSEKPSLVESNDATDDLSSTPTDVESLPEGLDGHSDVPPMKDMTTPISEHDLAELNKYMRVPATMEDLENYRYRYIVWGDELLRLSISEGVDMYEVANLNDIDNLDLIYAGEVFRLPK